MPIDSSVIVRWTETNSVAAPVWSSLACLLSDAERGKAARFCKEADRLAYVAAHVLARKVISECLGIHGSKVEFQLGQHGKPHVAGSDLEFSLSHAEGLAGVAISRHELGLDIERTDRPFDSDAAAQAFSTRELLLIQRAEEKTRDVLQYQLWTLKEAFLKAKGVGLTIDPKLVEFDISGRFGIPALNDKSTSIHWAIESFWPTRTHVSSIAVRGPPTDHRSIDCRLVSPAELLHG